MNERAAPTPDSPDNDSTDDQEFDLLDLLVVAAENVKLLILGPLIVGLLALGGAYALPKTYQSVSVLSAGEGTPYAPGSCDRSRVGSSATEVNPAVVGSWARSSDLLALALKDSGLFKGKSGEEAVGLARAMITATVGKQDKLVTLITEGETPEAAHQLNQRVLNQILNQLEIQKASVAAAVAMEKELGNLLISGKFATEAGSQSLSNLLESKTKLVESVAQLQLQLEGLSASNVVQTPSLPERPIKPNKALVAVSATLLSAVVLVLFVFVRHSLRNAASDPEAAAKLQRIRRGLGFRN